MANATAEMMAGQGDKSRLHALASAGPRTCGVQHPDLRSTISTIAPRPTVHAPCDFTAISCSRNRRAATNFAKSRKRGIKTLQGVGIAGGEQAHEPRASLKRNCSAELRGLD